MRKLNMDDMNSLNAIAGFLRCIGCHDMSDVLLGIQARTTEMLQKEEANVTGGNLKPED